MTVHVVRGTDATLRGAVVDELVLELLAGEDRSLALEDLTVPSRTADGEAGGAEGRTGAVDAAINASSSPPFMTAVRVVVLREVGALTAADVEPLVRYLDDPLPTTALVLVAGGGTMPPGLTRKLKELGAAVQERATASEKTGEVLVQAARQAGIELRPDALKLITDHLGDDAGRSSSLIDVLVAAHGPGATLDAAAVSPYLGEAGAVPGYLLTDAVTSGDVARALAVLERLLTVSSARQPKPMHPLQVMGLLHGQYRRMLVLDDPSVRSGADAVAALERTLHLKVKEYPARKAMDAARALGTDGLRQAYDLLAQADLDLKGARAIPEHAVMELLVARLAGLARSRGRGARSGDRSRR